ncbi:unnamed protein product [Closterium sp. NIES-54]
MGPPLALVMAHPIAQPVVCLVSAMTITSSRCPAAARRPHATHAAARRLVVPPLVAMCQRKHQQNPLHHPINRRSITLVANPATLPVLVSRPAQRAIHADGPASEHVCKPADVPADGPARDSRQDHRQLFAPTPVRTLSVAPSSPPFRSTRPPAIPPVPATSPARCAPATIPTRPPIGPSSTAATSLSSAAAVALPDHITRASLSIPVVGGGDGGGSQWGGCGGSGAAPPAAALLPTATGAAAEPAATAAGAVATTAAATTGVAATAVATTAGAAATAAAAATADAATAAAIAAVATSKWHASTGVGSSGLVRWGVV